MVSCSIYTYILTHIPCVYACERTTNGKRGRDSDLEKLNLSCPVTVNFCKRGARHELAGVAL